MFKMIIAKAIKKHGLKAILIKVGDIAVKVTKTKKAFSLKLIMIFVIGNPTKT